MLLQALANLLPRPVPWSFDNRLVGGKATASCFSSSHTNHWWPRRKGGDDAEDTGPQPDVEGEENAWNSAFEQREPSRRRDLPRRIHVLGVGSVGLLIAHSLAGIPNRPPVTFLTRTRASARNFEAIGRCIELVTDGVSDIRGGFDVEHAFEQTESLYPSVASSHPPTRHQAHTPQEFRSGEALRTTSATQPGSPDQTLVSEQVVVDDAGFDASPNVLGSEAVSSGDEQDSGTESTSSYDEGIISNLIVSLKAKDILAISKVSHRLTRDSAILFVQNGMGYIEEINKKIFPNPETRPTYLIGVVTHGAKRSRAYTVIHAGHGTFALAIMPRAHPGEADYVSPSARYLLRSITRTPVLAAVAYGPTDILQQQLEKLAVNCVLNPLTAIMDCANGEIMHNFHISRIMRLVLAEVSLVVRSLPELQSVPNVQSRFDPGRLELYTIQVASMTSQNLSSMLQDVREGKETEIDYINGYIVRKGEELGIRCIMNYMLMQMLEAKQKIVARNDSERLPIGNEDSLKVIRT